MTEQNTAGTGVEDRVARTGGVSYLQIPARDIAESAEFYRAVFGWRLRGTPDAPSFSDGTGHVIGHWRTDLPAAGQAGVLPYLRHQPRRHPTRGGRARRRDRHPALPGRKPLGDHHPGPRRQRHRHLAGRAMLNRLEQLSDVPADTPTHAGGPGSVPASGQIPMGIHSHSRPNRVIFPEPPHLPWRTCKLRISAGQTASPGQSGR